MQWSAAQEREGGLHGLFMLGLNAEATATAATAAVEVVADISSPDNDLAADDEVAQSVSAFS